MLFISQQGNIMREFYKHIFQRTTAKSLRFLLKNGGGRNTSCQGEKEGRMEKEHKGVIVEQAEICLRVKGIVIVLPVLSPFLSGIKST